MNEENNFNTVGEPSTIDTPVTPVQEPVINNNVNNTPKKGKKGLLVIIVILVILLLGTGGYLAYSKGWIGKDKEKQSEKKEDKEEKVDVSAVLEKLHGAWGNKTTIMQINKDSKKYLIGQYHTDGVISGTIQNIKKLSDNVFELEIYSEGCKGNDCMVESESETHYVILEINEEEKIIKSNGVEYKFITKDLTNDKALEDYYNQNVNNGEVAPTTEPQIFKVGNDKYIDNQEHSIGQFKLNGITYNVVYQQEKAEGLPYGFKTKVKFSQGTQKSGEVEIIGGGVDEVAIIDNKYIFVKEARDIYDIEGTSFLLLNDSFNVVEEIQGVSGYALRENGQVVDGSDVQRTLGYIDSNHFKVGVCTHKAGENSQTYKEYTYTVKDGNISKNETFSKGSAFCSAQME